MDFKTIDDEDELTSSAGLLGGVSRGKVLFARFPRPCTDECTASLCATLISSSTLATCATRSCFFFVLAAAVFLLFAFSAATSADDLRAVVLNNSARNLWENPIELQPFFLWVIAMFWALRFCLQLVQYPVGGLGTGKMGLPGIPNMDGYPVGVIGWHTGIPA